MSTHVNFLSFGKFLRSQPFFQVFGIKGIESMLHLDSEFTVSVFFNTRCLTLISYVTLQQTNWDIHAFGDFEEIKKWDCKTTHDKNGEVDNDNCCATHDISTFCRYINWKNKCNSSSQSYTKFLEHKKFRDIPANHIKNWYFWLITVPPDLLLAVLTIAVNG